MQGTVIPAVEKNYPQLIPSGKKNGPEWRETAPKVGVKVTPSRVKRNPGYRHKGDPQWKEVIPPERRVISSEGNDPKWIKVTLSNGKSDPK